MKKNLNFPPTSINKRTRSRAKSIEQYLRSISEYLSSYATNINEYLFRDLYFVLTTHVYGCTLIYLFIRNIFRTIYPRPNLHNRNTAISNISFTYRSSYSISYFRNIFATSVTNNASISI